MLMWETRFENLMSWVGCSYRSPVPRGPSARRDGTNQGTRKADAMLKAKTPNKQQRAHATRTYWDGSPVPSGPLHTSGGRMHAFTPLGDRGGAVTSVPLMASRALNIATPSAVPAGAPAI